MSIRSISTDGILLRSDVKPPSAWIPSFVVIRQLDRSPHKEENLRRTGSELLRQKRRSHQLVEK